MTEENTTVDSVENSDSTAVAENSEKDKKNQTIDPSKPEEKAKSHGDRKGRSKGRTRRGSFKREPKEFEEIILCISRVTRVVKGGRRMRFLVTVIIGDKKGKVGIGSGKSGEVVESIKKAVTQAKKKLVKVPILNNTLPHEVNAKYKASKVLLFPAPEGKGIIAGGAVRKILELAGYHNILSKAHGSRNPLNLAKATFKALDQLQNIKKVEEKDEDKTEKNKEEKVKDEAKDTKKEKTNETKPKPKKTVKKVAETDSKKNSKTKK